MKQAMTVIAAVLVHAFAFGDISPYVSGTVLTVPEGEIVTATADDATAVAALTEVVFADATGVFEMTGAATLSLSAGVSGAGTVKVTSATSLTLSGDCRGFTGGWESSETPIVVTSRYGLGDAGTVGHSSSYNFGCYIRHAELATPITFSGDGLTNDGDNSDNVTNVRSWK